MEKKELEFKISKIVNDANICSRAIERAKERNLSLIEQDYSYCFLEIDKALFYLGYTLEEDGRRADCGEGIEYMHYKAVKDKELWK